MTNEEAGRLICRGRSALGLSQSNLALWLGVRRATVSHWERGARALTAKRLFDLADRFDGFDDQAANVLRGFALVRYYGDFDERGDAA